MPNVINKMIVRELTGAVEGSDSMLICSFRGLSVAETEELRDSLAEHGVRLRMVRNRLARIAMKANEVEIPEDMFSGNVACVWGGPEEAIAAAKVLHKSPVRKQGKVSLRGGIMEGNLLDAQEAQALADLPGRDELRAMMLSAISGPARGLVGVLAAVPASVARVLQARVDAGDSGGDAPADAPADAPDQAADEAADPGA